VTNVVDIDFGLIGLRLQERVALPFGPRSRLRRNHAYGLFPPFGVDR